MYRISRNFNCVETKHHRFCMSLFIDRGNNLENDHSKDSICGLQEILMINVIPVKPVLSRKTNCELFHELLL